MHRLLARQLKKAFGRSDNFPEDLQRLIDTVDDAYTGSDNDRAMIERSMDISSRELFERNQALAAAEKKFREIFENVTEGIFHVTPEGRCTSANRAMALICGYDTPAQLMELLDIQNGLYVDPARRAEILAMIEQQGLARECPSQWRRRDGAVIWVAETLRPVRDTEGRILYYEAVVRDITARKRVEAEHEELQHKLLTISRRAGMAEVATGVLHNVGNVLNSINVAATLVMKTLERSELDSLGKVAQMIDERRDTIGQFLSEDPRGKLVPNFLMQLSGCLEKERDLVRGELSTLVTGVEHIKQIINAQQSLAKHNTVLGSAKPHTIAETAISMQIGTMERASIDIVRCFADLPAVEIDQHKILQILINLLSNARHAVKNHITDGPRRITLAVESADPAKPASVRFIVADTGVGIAPENQAKLFAHGFTTKTEGHGFGLHSCANAATEMGGTLTCHSDGLGTGATFTLEVPVTLSP
jgi:PAS domain S-box-containing protein